MLVEYDTGERELYDLIVDPYQLQSKSRTENESLYSALETRLYNLRDCSGAACRTAEWTTDTTAPRVTSTVPDTNVTGVSPSANVTAAFSEDMMASTIHGSTFTLTKPDGPDADTDPDPVAGVVNYDSTTKKATLVLTADLDYSTNYTATVTTGTEDLAGNHLDQSSTLSGLQQKVWSFTVSN